jgi:hypothetical protein
MSAKRSKIGKKVETAVLLACVRRCCLCVFLDKRTQKRKGQIAHLNRDRSDSSFKNLVYLCLEHHDEYDGQTRLSKSLTVSEVRTYRDRLYAKNPAFKQPPKDSKRKARATSHWPSNTPEYAMLRKRYKKETDYYSDPWRFPLWQVGNLPEFFAYKARNRCDGICLIERIDLPDDRIVVVCIEAAGTPGQSITNTVESLCFQVCERFEIPYRRLVWLEHYDVFDDSRWNMVTFEKHPPDYVFEGPKWTEMTPAMWRDLRLRPKKKLRMRNGVFESKITKLFPWPTEAILES